MSKKLIKGKSFREKERPECRGSELDRRDHNAGGRGDIGSRKMSYKRQRFRTRRIQSRKPKRRNEEAAAEEKEVAVALSPIRPIQIFTLLNSQL